MDKKVQDQAGQYVSEKLDSYGHKIGEKIQNIQDTEKYIGIKNGNDIVIFATRNGFFCLAWNQSGSNRWSLTSK